MLNELKLDYVILLILKFFVIKLFKPDWLEINLKNEKKHAILFKNLFILNIKFKKIYIYFRFIYFHIFLIYFLKIEKLNIKGTIKTLILLLYFAIDLYTFI